MGSALKGGMGGQSVVGEVARVGTCSLRRLAGHHTVLPCLSRQCTCRPRSGPKSDAVPPPENWHQRPVAAPWEGHREQAGVAASLGGQELAQNHLCLTLALREGPPDLGLTAISTRLRVTVSPNRRLSIRSARPPA